jgi:hypothetical protein
LRATWLQWKQRSRFPATTCKHSTDIPGTRQVGEHDLTPPPWPARAATTPSLATCASSRYASTPIWATASSSATTPNGPAATPRSAPRSSPASKSTSPTATACPPATAPSSPGALKTKPAFNRFLRTTPTGKLRIDRTAVRRDAHDDGKYLLRTPNQTLTPDDIADCYKALYQAERGWRDLKTIQVNLRPVFH